MNNEIVHELTKEGLEEVEKRLEYLIKVERPANVQAIKEARAQGDLSENADYDAARNQQSSIEAEIHELEEIIKHHVIIEKKSTDVVGLGSTVTVKFDGMPEETYEIVGELQANPFEYKVSNQSPLYKAIEGKKAGSHVEFVSHGEKVQKVDIIEVK